MTATINTETMTLEEITAIAGSALVITDGVSGVWEPDCFLAALTNETGRPCGEYTAFDKGAWAKELAEATED